MDLISIKYISELLWATVEASAFDLPFGQPPTEEVPINQVQSIRNCQGAHATER